MATAAPISVDLYLHTEYEPAAEYVDGEVELRPMGEYDHSTWQQAIEQWFLEHARQWNIRVRCELRIQVKATRFRIPDVVVFDRGRAPEQILTHPPIAVFEVLSPEDTTSRTLVKLADYKEMGISGIFVVDPRLERTYRFTEGNLLQSAPVELLAGTEALVDWNGIANLRDLE